MPSRRRVWRFAAGLGFAATIPLIAAACAGTEPVAAVDIGMQKLRCPRGEVETTLSRRTSKVREYVVACDFMYTRVHCTDTGCYPAKIKPPCFGGVDCFEEDPVTLDWKLEEPGD
jgi:hypothetical protein